MKAVMKAVRYYEFGEPAEVVRVDEIPVPAPLRGEVLVRLTARPVSPSVLMALSGKYGVHPQLPAVPGAERQTALRSRGERSVLSDEAPQSILSWTIPQRISREEIGRGVGAVVSGHCVFSIDGGRIVRPGGSECGSAPI